MSFGLAGLFVSYTDLLVEYGCLMSFLKKTAMFSESFFFSMACYYIISSIKNVLVISLSTDLQGYGHNFGRIQIY